MITYAKMLHGLRAAAIVVGGGSVAGRKIRYLLDAGTRVRVVASESVAEPRALTRGHRRLEIVLATYQAIPPKVQAWR